MTRPLRLIIFDVDGTLVDSQGSIVSAMTAAFDSAGLPVPDRDAILSIVGLSLDQAMHRLAPEHAVPARDRLVQAYKDAYFAQRQAQGESASPLYPGAVETLEFLAAEPDTVLGVATGKSRRGLDAVLEVHGLERMFVTRQVADHHPSKPHPSMILTAMEEAGTVAADTAMIGDTSFDMDMAQAAGVPGIGVSWGYHARGQLRAAHSVIDRFSDLPPTLARIWDTGDE